MRTLIRFLLAGLICTICRAADNNPELLTICEVMHTPQNFNHKPVLIAGRISKRGNRRYLGEDGCEGGGKELWIRFDAGSGPMPPDSFAVSTADVKRKFDTITPHTALKEFKFGTGEYDRWAMVLGRFELDTPPKVDASAAPAGAVVGEIICRGEALIFLWAGP